MYELIKKYFRENRQWQFSELDAAVVVLGINGQNGNIQCACKVYEEDKKFIFHSICGTNIPESKRNDVLTLLNDLNCRTFIGNFEMTPTDGEVRFRVGFIYEGVEINDNLIDNLIIPPIASMDQALPAIMGLVYGDLTVEQAIELTTS